MKPLSQTEQRAVELLRRNAGCISSFGIDDTNQKGKFGDIIPGLNVYRKLEKKGIVYFTEEEPVIDKETGVAFDLTPLICLTEAIK